MFTTIYFSLRRLKNFQKLFQLKPDQGSRDLGTTNHINLVELSTTVVHWSNYSNNDFTTEIPWYISRFLVVLQRQIIEYDSYSTSRTQ